MKGTYKLNYKNIQLRIYNYGIPAKEIAKFSNFPDACQCLKSFNDHLIDIYGKMPDNIFYYVECILNGKKEIHVNYKNYEMEDIDLKCAKIYSMQENLISA